MGNYNLYYGNVLRCLRSGKDNLTGTLTNTIYLGGVYLVELRENRFVLLEEILSGKKDKQIFKTYGFSTGELYVDYKSLINVNNLVAENILQQSENVEKRGKSK